MGGRREGARPSGQEGGHQAGIVSWPLLLAGGDPPFVASAGTRFPTPPPIAGPSAAASAADVRDMERCSYLAHVILINSDKRLTCPRRARPLGFFTPTATGGLLCHEDMPCSGQPHPTS